MFIRQHDSNLIQNILYLIDKIQNGSWSKSGQYHTLGTWERKRLRQCKEIIRHHWDRYSTMMTLFMMKTPSVVWWKTKIATLSERFRNPNIQKIRKHIRHTRCFHVLSTIHLRLSVNLSSYMNQLFLWITLFFHNDNVNITMPKVCLI